MADKDNDWNPGAYDRFRGLRLRPALDLMHAVGAVPSGPVVDLGCGSGAAGPMLRSRFPDRTLLGVDLSAAMLAKAEGTDVYDTLLHGDVANWHPDTPPALMFCNAVLHWVPNHDTLIPRLGQCLAPGGVLAIQMPGQNAEPSHAAWRSLSGGATEGPGILSPEAYAAMLAPMGETDIWETRYFQRLAPAKDGHPVRLFTQSTYGKPFLDALTIDAQKALCAAYDAEVEQAYPRDADGTVLFPFRRVFVVFRRAANRK